MKHIKSILAVCAVFLFALTSTSSADPTPDQKAALVTLAGTWKVTYPKNGERLYEFDQSKNVKSLDGKTKMHAVMKEGPDGCFEYLFQNMNYYQVFVFGDNITIKNWLTKEAYKRGLEPNQIGKGERIKAP